jgi:hypothetical protein
MTASVTPWEKQGCAECRAAWSRADRTPLQLLGTNPIAHARIHKCAACGSYWDENERYSQQVPQDEALALLAGAQDV